MAWRFVCGWQWIGSLHSQVQIGRICLAQLCASRWCPTLYIIFGRNESQSLDSGLNKTLDAPCPNQPPNPSFVQPHSPYLHECQHIENGGMENTHTTNLVFLSVLSVSSPQQNTNTMYHAARYTLHTILNLLIHSLRGLGKQWHSRTVRGFT